MAEVASAVQSDGRSVELAGDSPCDDPSLTDPDRKFTITLDRSLDEPVRSWAGVEP